MAADENLPELSSPLAAASGNLLSPRFGNVGVDEPARRRGDAVRRESEIRFIAVVVGGAEPSRNMGPQTRSARPDSRFVQSDFHGDVGDPDLRTVAAIGATHESIRDHPQPES